MTIQLRDAPEIEELWDAVTSGRVSYLTYVALQAAISRPFGSIAEVDGDAGTHIDPVSTLSVPNSGVYRRVEAGWQWISAVTGGGGGGGGLTEEQVEDLVAAMFVGGGGNVTATYNDTTDKVALNAPASSTDAEVVRDTVAAFAVAGANMTITHDDVGNTLTFSSAGGGGGSGNYLSVTAYGTTGDGVADDTAEIVAAIAAAKLAQRPLFFPKGTYLISSTVNFEDVGILGEGAESTIFKPTHVGVALQIGKPVGTSIIDTQHREFANFGILANSTTTDALLIMRSIYCRYSGIEVRHSVGIGASYRSFRISGATYYNRFDSCFSDCTTEDLPTNGIGFSIGNGENEAAHEFAACNTNVFVNCRANRIRWGTDIDNASGIIWLGGGNEQADFRLRGSGNQILGPWLESSSLIVDGFTPATGSGGFGSAQTPSRNVFKAAGPPPHVFLNTSTGIELEGTFGNVTIGAAAYNTVLRGRVNGAFTNGGQDGRFDFIESGYHQMLVQRGSNIAFHAKMDDSVTEIILPGSGPRKIRSHSAGNMELNGGTQPVGLAGSVPALLFPETTDPGSAAANQCLLFAVDNGSGKTQLKVRFPSGVAQTIATEP